MDPDEWPADGDDGTALGLILILAGALAGAAMALFLSLARSGGIPS